MNKTISILGLFLGFAAFLAPLVGKTPPAVGFEQKTGATLPLDLPWKTPGGETVSLRTLLNGRPLVLGMGYNECPMLCGEAVRGLIQTLLQIDAQPGADYSVVFLSVDPDEAPELAAEAEKNFAAALDLDRTDAVHFLRGGKKVIDRTAEAIGFDYSYVPASDQYAHPAGWVVVTPEGVISAYAFGVRYDEERFAADIRQAAGGEIGGEKPSLLLRCLQYDPLKGPYGSAIKTFLQVAAGLTVLVLILWILRAERKKRKEEKR